MARKHTPLNPRQAGTVILLLVLVIWLIFLVIGIYRKEQIARTTVTETRNELVALDARNKTISDTVNGFDTQRGQEASLRETFGVAKPGEDVVIVVAKKDLPPPPALTFWQKVLQFLGF